MFSFFNIMFRFLGLVRLSNFYKSNPNIFSWIYSTACLTLSFLWSQWQELICISLDVSTQAHLVWFWKTQVCHSAVCSGKVMLVYVARSKWHTGVQRSWKSVVATGWSHRKLLFKYSPWFCECCQCWIVVMDTSAQTPPGTGNVSMSCPGNSWNSDWDLWVFT